MALKLEIILCEPKHLEDSSNLVVHEKLSKKKLVTLFLHSNALPLIIASSTQRCHIFLAWVARRVHACQSGNCKGTHVNFLQHKLNPLFQQLQKK